SSRDGLQHYCRRVDGLNLCTYDPSRAPQSRILSQQLLPPYKLGTTFRAQERPPASMILANFDMKPAVARWTIGHLAALYVRLASAPKCDLQLQLTFATRGALLNRNHTLQRAFISVNRHPIDRLFFSLKGKNDKRTVIIPRALVGTQITAIQFALPDAVSPFELGTGNDTRLLGLYISSVRITSAGAGAVLHRNKAAATGK
ncbi:MAG TPA: hypothetical protein VMF67_04285, partial [Rhizomicrobium sp.]|nr:hypothetical protein [Rhizomicrobium sp.]